MSKVWRQNIREIKAGALLVILTVGAVGLCTTNRGSSRYLASTSREMSEQSVASTTLDTGEAIQVPAECIAPTRGFSGGVYTFLNRFPVSRRDRRLDFDPTYIRNQPGAQNVVWVKPECQGWLDTQATKSLQRYFMSGNTAAFPYHASTLRPYCGKTPEVVACTMPLPIDRSALMRTDQTVVPAPLNQARTSYRNSEVQNLKLFAIEDANSEPDLHAYQIGIERARRGGEDWDVIRHGRTRYLALGTPPRAHSFYDISQLSEQVQPLRLRASARMGQESLRYAMVRFLTARAEGLGAYWDRALRFNPQGRERWTQPSADQGSAFSFMEVRGHNAELLATIQRYSSESWYDDVLVGFTSGLMVQIGDQLMRASNSDELMQTASYWWAVRSLQLALSCEEVQPGVFTYPPGGERLIGLQWLYQSCRREYMQTATNHLSQWVEQSRGLALESITWQLTRVFGSRAERLNLSMSVLDQIQQQFQQGVVPSALGLSVLFFELNQLLHEKNERKLLLWNKLEVASNEDLGKIDSIIGKYRNFFLQVGPAVARREFTLAAHYEQILGAWRYFGEVLGLPDWNTLEEVRASGASGSTSLSRLMESLERDFTGSTPIEAVASALDRSRWTFENVSGAQQSEVCRSWLNFADRYRRGGTGVRLPVTPLDTDQLSTPHCLGLIPAWIREPDRTLQSSWSALMSQCERGHRLSCATLMTLGAPEVQQWSLQRWEQLLRSERPMDLLTWRYFVHAFAMRPDVQALMASVPESGSSRRSARIRAVVIPPESQEVVRTMVSISKDVMRSLLPWVGQEGVTNWARFESEIAGWERVGGVIYTEHTLPENPIYALGRYSVWNAELYLALQKIPEAMALTCLSQAGSETELRNWGQQFTHGYFDFPSLPSPVRRRFGSIFQTPKSCDFPTRHSFGVQSYLSSCANGMRISVGRDATPEGQGELEDRQAPSSFGSGVR